MISQKTFSLIIGFLFFSFLYMGAPLPMVAFPLIVICFLYLFLDGWIELKELKKQGGKEVKEEQYKILEEERKDIQTFCQIFKTNNFLEIGEKGVKTLILRSENDEDEAFALRLSRLQNEEYLKIYSYLKETPSLEEVPNYFGMPWEWEDYVEEVINENIAEVLIPAAKDRINIHLNILSQKKLELIYSDDFGDRQFYKWNEYARNYCDTKVLPYLEESQTIGWLQRNEHDQKAKILKEKIYELVLAVEEKSSLGYQTDMAGVDYEQYCAQRLTEDGWIVSQTQKTGDRGADLVAELDGIKLVIQCKRYSKPVGNKAVQEIFSAKSIYGADMAAVVTNNTYTQQTHQDANALKVILISNNQIEQLTSIVSGSAS